jgi:hypothetical protein
VRRRRTVGVALGIAAATAIALLSVQTGFAQVVLQVAGLVAAPSASAATVAATPDPLPTVVATPAPSYGGGVDLTPSAIPSYAAPVQVLDPNGKPMMVCPIHGASDPACGPPVTGCAPGQTVVANAGCQDPPTPPRGCPGAIHYPNGFTSLPPCNLPPYVAPTPSPTPAPTP